RSSVDRSFKRAYRTNLIANTTALIGAVTLYVLTVGAVRGFAFFLGLATFLDLVVIWAFTRPAVALLARNPAVARSGFVTAGKGESIWSRLYGGRTSFRFVAPWRRWFALSAAVIVAGLVALGVNGLNLGMEFEGG